MLPILSGPQFANWPSYARAHCIAKHNKYDDYARNAPTLSLTSSVIFPYHRVIEPGADNEQSIIVCNDV